MEEVFTFVKMAERVFVEIFTDMSGSSSEEREF